MRIDHMMITAISHLIGQLMRRAITALALAAFVVVAIYHFTVAGIVALDVRFGAIDAQLIVGGIYGGLALISLMVLLAMGRKLTAAATPMLTSNPREMQLVMLVEAVMLGYALAQKRERAS
jgi:hypothetical protein